MTYHDENWQPIAFTDISSLQMQKIVTGSNNEVNAQYGEDSYRNLRAIELEVLHSYCRNRLDPKVKPKATQVVISRSWDHMPPIEWIYKLEIFIITFYDINGSEIAQFESKVVPNLTSIFYSTFEEYIDLQNLKENNIIDNSECTIF